MKYVFSRKMALLLVSTTLVASLTSCMARSEEVSHADSFSSELRNLHFSSLSASDASTPAQIHEKTIQIPEGEQAVYTASLTYAEGDSVSLQFGTAELLAMEAGTFRVCGSLIQGDFAPGGYTVQVTVNPPQKMVTVELTLPDGGTLRRGSYEFLGGEQFCWYGTRADAVTVAEVQYAAATPADYQVSTEENVPKSFSSQVFNLVSSFDDARTGRLFAWTARTIFTRGSEGMALRYRAKGETEWKQVDARQLPETTENRQQDFYKADVTGLTADTEYEYQFGLKGVEDSEKWSPIYTFKTAAEEIDSFRFVALGDTQSSGWEGGYAYSQAALNLAFADAQNPAFILHTGDVNERGSNLNNWKRYFRAIADYAPSVPHFATVGNHDTWGDDQNNYFSLHFNHPDNGASALDPAITDQITDGYLSIQVANPEDTIYSYDYGNAHFIVLHSGSYVAQDEYFLEAQRQWLINDLEANKDARWKIILVHEPVYHRKGGGESRPWLYDVIESYGVDLVIQGHSHLVTRTYPMKDGRIVTKSSPDLIEKGTGTVYTTIGSVTTGHDTAGENTVEECLLIATPESQQATYTVVSVEKDRLIMTVKQLNGLVVDSFTIRGEPEEETTAGDTTGDTTEDTTEDTTAPAQSGCSSVITVSAVTTGLVVLMSAGLLLKKKEQDADGQG